MVDSKPKTKPVVAPAKKEPDSNLVRFRVDKDLKDAAADACDALGFDLNDVLRSVVRRIANEHAIPFQVNPPARPDPTKAPFTEYGAYLDKDLAHLKAELTLSLLATFIADRAKRLAEERDKPKPNVKLRQRWEREMREAAGYHRTLNTRDLALVERVDAKYRALLAEPR